MHKEHRSEYKTQQDKAYEAFDKLREQMGDTALLEELMQAMSSNEAMANFDHIARMNDIELESNESEE